MKCVSRLAVLALVFALGAATSSYGQSFQEGFDDFELGSDIDGQSNWETWDRAGVTVFVTDEESVSEPHAIAFDPNSDVVWVTRGVDSGTWVASGSVFIPSDMTGEAFFILLSQYSHGGAKNWSTQVRFTPDAIESLGGTNFAGTGTMPGIIEEWIDLRVEIDLERNRQKIFVAGELLDETLWTQDGLPEFQAFDLFSTASRFFMDDISLSPCVEISVDASEGVAPFEVQLSAASLGCGTELIDSVSWDFGDGTEGEGETVSHTYEEIGFYSAVATVVDSEGFEFKQAVKILVSCESSDVPEWDLAVLGESEQLGCVAPDGECISMVEGGVGIEAAGDTARFLYREVEGDFSASVRIENHDLPLNGMAAIMARTALGADDPFVASGIGVRTAVRPILLRRSAAGRSPVPRVESSPDIDGAFWVRLDRVGEDFFQYTSEDGANWTELNSRVLAAAGESMFVGLVVTGAEGEVGSATFCESKIEAAESSNSFRRGDADQSGGLQLTDAIFLLNHLFLAGPRPACEDSADADDDGAMNITDGIYTLSFLFLAGPPPPAPGAADCGPDPESDDALGCESYQGC